MWKWLLKGLLAVTSDPRVRQWVRRKAGKLIEAAAQKREKEVSDLYDAAGIEKPKPPELPRPRVSRMIRTERDTLKPGAIVVVDGVTFQVRRLISASAKECLYEAESV